MPRDDSWQLGVDASLSRLPFLVAQEEEGRGKVLETLPFFSYTLTLTLSSGRLKYVEGTFDEDYI
jgi:hypothetical protein